MTETCDVVVVKNNPTKSTYTQTLGKAGLDVVVLDKQQFPRDKVCAGWITPAVAESLELDLADYGAERVLQPINGFRTGRLGAATREVHYPATVSFGIRRCEFDDYLLARCGARLRTGEALRSLERRGTGWRVNGDLDASLVIGAGGHFCPVARHLGNQLGREEQVVAAQEIEFAMAPHQRAACRVQGEVPELYFCADLKGYGWCFRKGDHLNIGLGREDNHRLAEHVAAFVHDLQKAGRIPTDLPGRFKGHAYLLYGHTPRRVVADGVMLIGDSAGLAYPQSGEGIRPAVESALLAAAVVGAAAGDYTAARLAAYEERLTARFGPRAAPPAAGPHLPEGLRNWMAGRLLANGWFARHVVLDRWFLHTRQPPLTALN